jgi:hypothetical protein
LRAKHSQFAARGLPAVGFFSHIHPHSIFNFINYLNNSRQILPYSVTLQLNSTAGNPGPNLHTKIEMTLVTIL